MKKTTLFTTLALVVIVAIALSTATFAWYSSQNQVEISNTTFTAAAASDANIKIKWDGQTEDIGTSIVGKNIIDMKPMIPKINPGADQDDDTDGVQVATLAQFVFNSAPKDAAGNFGAVSSSNPSYFMSEDGKDTFMVTNEPNSKTVTSLTFKANITGDNANIIRIAIFKVNDSTATYVGTLSNTADTYYGIISANSATNTLTTKYDATIGSTGVTDTVSIAANGSQSYKIVVWYDGPSLTDDLNSKSASIALTIDASVATSD